jgi:glucose-1-phosphate thymidylyltransferase
MRRGIVLAGGSGTRLWPMTSSVCKQLLPVYDKPMIYYPLSVLMLAGVREILIITTPDDQRLFQKLLGSGARWGMNFSYVIQPSPAGLAQAYILGEEFVAGEPSAMILGDNIFYGHGLPELLVAADARADGATVFGYHVQDPERYGVVEFDQSGRAVSIEEKPNHPKSNYAVTGLYFYDGKASAMARQIKPSARGELEITTLNQMYLERDALNVQLMGRGFAWLDTGTYDSLIEASEFVRTIERRTGMKVCCPEEIAFEKGYIGAEDLIGFSRELPNNPYCQYLRALGEAAVASVPQRGKATLL